MISPELLRRYPFFAGLSDDEITTLAKLGRQLSVDAGERFFDEGDTLKELFFVVEGKVAITIGIPDRSKEQSASEMIMGNFDARDQVVSEVGAGQLFAWSALIPPHTSTAGAVATTSCQVVAFDSEELLRIFPENCHFGYKMLEKVAGVIRERLRDMRIQSLAFITE